MKKVCLQDFKNDPKLLEVLQEFLTWYQDLSIREEMIQKQSKPGCIDVGNCHSRIDSDSGIDGGDWYYTTIAKTLKELLDLLESPESSRKSSKDEL